MKGTYFYTHAAKVYPTVELASYSLRVEVIDQTAKSYKIKYLEFHANGARPGTTAWVQKRKVKLDGEAVKPERQYDPELIRKPYKD